MALLMWKGFLVLLYVISMTCVVLAQDTVVVICPITTTPNVTEPSKPDAAVVWSPIPSANDSNSTALNVTCVNDNNEEVQSDDRFSVGVNTITCSATDALGNEGNCTFIAPVMDNEKPIVTCPNDARQDVDSSKPNATVDWSPAPSATDNVDELGPPNVTCKDKNDQVVVSEGIYPVGVNTITCSATDTADNEGQCVFNITVIDNEKPIVTCPNDTRQNVDSSKPTATVTWSSDPSATDVVGPLSPDVTCNDKSNQEVVSGGSYSVGVNTITCSATDTAGNEGNCTFTITVIDDEKPIVSCPNNTSPGVDPSKPTATVEWSPAPSATDNFDELGPVNVTCKDKNDQVVVSEGIYPVGENTITCSATDTAENEGNCTFTITVLDNEAPNVTCPYDRSVNVAEGKSTASITWVSLAYDVVDGERNTSCEPKQTMEFVNTTTVICTATDVANNDGSCEFTVTVTVDGESCSKNTGGCVCDEQNCICREDYNGPDCRDQDGFDCNASPSPTCDCSGSGVCKCKPGFKGTTCNDCKGCMNGGASQDIDNCQCECPAERFEPPICSGCKDCENGDNQNDDCVCKCRDLFEGDLCNVCPPDASCQNNGTLDPPSCSCNCPSPYTGTDCTECLTCLNDGTAQNATTCTCACSEGFLPPLCAVCDDCQNGGQYQNDFTCACQCPNLYTGLTCKVCPSGNVCENSGVMDRENCLCKCTDEWTGRNCAEPVPSLPDDEYPDPPADANIEKKVLIEIEVTFDENGELKCDPNKNKMSDACLKLQDTFITGVENEYKRLAGFNRVEVTKLKKGSVIFQHLAIYDYNKMVPSQRGISALDLYLATVAKAVETEKLGGLVVASDCIKCQAAKDETNMCTTTKPKCGIGLQVAEVKNGNSCYYVCRASCKVQTEYCNDGTCVQESDGVMSCSCPQSTEYMYIGLKCQLVVNLLWLYVGCGIGGGVLLLLLFILFCCVVQYRKQVKRLESEEEDESHEGEMKGEICAVHHNNKGYVRESSSNADEQPEGETHIPEAVRPYSYIYRNGNGVGVSRSSSGAAAVKNRYESTLAKDRERDTSSDQAEESGNKTRGSYFWGNLTVPVKEEAEMIPMTSEIDPTKMYKIQRPQVSVNKNEDLPERDYF